MSQDSFALARRHIDTVSVSHTQDGYHLQVVAARPTDQVRPEDMIADRAICSAMLGVLSNFIGGRIPTTVTFSQSIIVVVWHVWELADNRDAIEQHIYDMVEMCPDCTPDRAEHMERSTLAAMVQAAFNSGGEKGG